MGMPTFNEIMLPFLQAIRSGSEIRVRSVADLMGDHFALSDAERSERLQNGERRIENRTWFASTYLFKAGLILRPKRGFVEISDEGKSLLDSNPDSVSEKLLMKYPAFADWKSKSGKTIASKDYNDSNTVFDSGSQGPSQTPIEAIEANARLLNEQLAEELLAEILVQDPSFFEQLVLDVMKAMGYGSAGSGQVVGGSGDGGIDGIINEDRLGLDKIYLQAKRYDRENKVTSPEIRGFIGSMASYGASKGVFISTSNFTSGAIKEAGKNPLYRLVLIDGQQLAQLMIDNDVGVSVQTTWMLKRLDSDYFDSDK